MTVEILTNRILEQPGCNNDKFPTCSKGVNARYKANQQNIVLEENDPNLDGKF